MCPSPWVWRRSTAQSAYEILSGRGEGYLDSLAGLIFFLLCGRVFQQKTHERIAFDRDYKCFFPLSVMRRTAAGEETRRHLQSRASATACCCATGN